MMIDALSYSQPKTLTSLTEADSELRRARC